ncbi:MAG: patatin-like phospholipase family protein [Planctomycetota bacterium]|jgi:predicted acylesterase/phospholipase RssA
MAKTSIQDEPRYREIMDEAEVIEAPCEPGDYRILRRVAANPENYFTVSFGAGSVPGIVGNCALSVMLDEIGLREHIREVWGVSAGSIVGTGYSVGTSGHEVLELLQSIDPKKALDLPLWDLIRSMFRQRRLPDGLVRGERFWETIAAGLKVNTFEECDPPLRLITCTDDGRATKIILRSGPLLPAIKASMCIPGVMFPIDDWRGEPWGYLDGAIVEKTPLPSVIDDHVRSGRKEQLVVLCTHFDDSGRVVKPKGFLQRSLRVIDRLEEVVWEHHLSLADQVDGCKFLVLNPRFEFAGMFDFDAVRVNYLWARKVFKEQLSNARIGGRFTAR